MTRELTKQGIIRREKLQKLAALKINPYQKAPKFTHNSKTLETAFGTQTKAVLATQKTPVSVVGRIMNFRGPFLILHDANGAVQCYIDKKGTPEMNQLMQLLDVGDIVFVAGLVMKTNTAAIAVRATKVELLTKALRPLPEKYHGLKNVEDRFRKRYVDLIMNQTTKATFWARSKIISAIRQFFNQLDYMEVETPILHSVLGGAAALPFTTYHNALHTPFYLRIATELPLKRLLVGGIDRVYEIGRLFRNEGVDTTHNPEFTTIEFYEAYSNLDGMIARTEALFAFLGQQLNLSEINYQGHVIKLATPFAKIHIVDAIKEVTKLDFWVEMSLGEMQKLAAKHHIKVLKYHTKGHIINSFFEHYVESTLIAPTFIYGHPFEISPLAALDRTNPRFTERAELFINGREYANMFTELNDPLDQLARFEAQLDEKKHGNDEASEIDYDFIEALEYGMPPAGGCGIGIDRLVMLLTKQTSIREVLFFPTLKTKK